MKAFPESSHSTAFAVTPRPIFADSHESNLNGPSNDEDLARQTFLILQEADIGSRRRPPSLYAVFQLYCVQEWTIPQIARKCRCSLGTVANRLDLLRHQVGLPPASLRRISSHFTILERDFRQAKRNYNRRRPAYLEYPSDD